MLPRVKNTNGCFYIFIVKILVSIDNIFIEVFSTFFII